ncbi:unnamed protein product [Prorocentrum cordatum]|uniref:CS domain-containing protein n=1 Tax=Prorocentrum cordatum TaxID=2364126 RepID=A0ABN9R289_9DINO|nr:unnamed protein product [Polarella glacialis]
MSKSRAPAPPLEAFEEACARSAVDKKAAFYRAEEVTACSPSPDKLFDAAEVVSGARGDRRAGRPLPDRISRLVLFADQRVDLHRRVARGSEAHIGSGQCTVDPDARSARRQQSKRGQKGDEGRKGSHDKEKGEQTEDPAAEPARDPKKTRRGGLDGKVTRGPKSAAARQNEDAAADDAGWGGIVVNIPKECALREVAAWPEVEKMGIPAPWPQDRPEGPMLRGPRAQRLCLDASGLSPRARGCPRRRTVRPSDFVEAVRVCAACRCEPLLRDKVSFDAHLAGAGAGVCLAAVPCAGPASLEGLAICGSDGVFGHLLQLAVPPTAPPAVRRELARRCASASRARGLRGFRAAADAGSAEGAVFEQLGWRTARQVYEANFSGGAGGADAGAPAGACSAPASSSQSRPAADEVVVDKESDDGDAAALNRASSKEEFGEHRLLDVTSRISKYSWDQSNSQVSIYISFDGAKALPDECMECHFRPRGVLLIISSGGKQHWFKIPNLCHAVDTAACRRAVKTDTIVLKLRKAEQGLQWSDLTDEKDQYKQRRAYRIEKGDLKDASTEQLIADMYQNATDEEREGLREAMRINREKRAEDARNAAAASNSKSF